MSTSLTPQQTAALQKFQAFAQQQSINPLLPYLDPNSKGGAWTSKSGKSSGAGFGFEGMLDQIGQRLSERAGLQDINDLGVKPVKTIDEDGNEYTTKEFYNKKTGQVISQGDYVDLGGWGQGPGMTYATLSVDESGKPKILTTGEDTNWFADKGPIMTALKFTPIGPVVAAIDAAQSYYNYGDPTKAILAAIPYTGAFDAIAGAAANVAGPAADVAANSGIAGLAQDLGASVDLANKIGQVGAQSVLGGTISAAKGKGFLPGARSGIVSGLANETANQLGQYTGLDKSLGSLYTPAKSLATSGVTSLLSGRPFDLGQAVKGAAINYGLNQAIGEGGAALGIDPKQQAALMKFYRFAAPMIAAQKRKP